MIIIEDNFYDDPEEVYQKAISVEYNSGEKEGGPAITVETAQKLLRAQITMNRNQKNQMETLIKLGTTFNLT